MFLVSFKGVLRSTWWDEGGGESPPPPPLNTCQNVIVGSKYGLWWLLGCRNKLNASIEPFLLFLWILRSTRLEKGANSTSSPQKFAQCHCGWKSGPLMVIGVPKYSNNPILAIFATFEGILQSTWCGRGGVWDFFSHKFSISNGLWEKNWPFRL